jgi:hypothetical protein
MPDEPKKGKRGKIEIEVYELPAEKCEGEKIVTITKDNFPLDFTAVIPPARMKL